MKKLLLGLLTALPIIAANATQFVATQGEDFIVADNVAACRPDVLARVKEQKPPAEYQFHRAVGHVGGKEYEGCFTEANGNVYVIWEDGDMGVIPSAAFHKLKET